MDMRVYYKRFFVRSLNHFKRPLAHLTNYLPWGYSIWGFLYVVLMYIFTGMQSIYISKFLIGLST